MRSRETPIIRATLDDLARLQVCAIRINAGRARGGKIVLAPKGTADIIGYYPRDALVPLQGTPGRWVRSGTFFAVEVKAPEDPAPVTDEQERFGNAVLRARAVWVVAHSSLEALRLLGFLPGAGMGP